MWLSIGATVALAVLAYDALLACPDGRSKALTCSLVVLALVGVWRPF
jgi:hypothetical protein